MIIFLPKRDVTLPEKMPQNNPKHHLKLPLVTLGHAQDLGRLFYNGISPKLPPELDFSTKSSSTGFLIEIHARPRTDYEAHVL